MTENKNFANISNSKNTKNTTDNIEEMAKIKSEKIYKDDDELESVGCLASCCQWFANKGILRKNSLKLAHRLKKRRSKKELDDGDEEVPEDKNDISAATLAVLAGR